jgi:transmembrane sensor
VSESSANESGPEAIAQAAAAWVLRCDRGLTAAEQDEFSDWLAGDPRHSEQLARHRRHWQRLEVLAQWRPEHSVRPNADLLAPPRARWSRFWPAAVGLAAAAAVAVVLWNGGAGSAERDSRIPTVARAAAADVAAVSRRTLADGTVVELNRGAVLTAQFTASERRVRLEQGEAHFSVTKDAARPFVVSVHGMDVRAVGTAFNVRLDRAALEVLVTEGRVRVSEASAGPEARGEIGDRPSLVPLLEAGQRAVVSLAAQPEAPQIATLTTSEIERVLAWQHRMLEFTAAPLGEVVAEFNRRNATQIVVGDPELAAIRISASFRSDNIDGFVRLVEMGFGARADRSGANEIRLRRAR